LRVGGDSELQEILPDSVKQIRRLPDGFTFDLLRLFGGDDAARSAFGRLPRAEVLFNFTGHQLEIESEEQGTFCRCDDECGPDHSPRNGRYYPLAVSGAIVGDRLRFRFVYSKNLHKRSTMERLAGSYRKSLLELVKVRSERMASCS
jgi:non-ribosomal peptide synthase protein (TIGR01720 family)